MELAEVFGELARLLLAAEDVDATFARICASAVGTVDGCECAGMSIVQGGKITPAAGTDDLPGAIDRIMSDVGEGPCLDAITEHDVFRTGDLLAEKRWPKFSVRAYDEVGVQSILSFRLFVAADTIGALNLYSSKLNAFGDDAIAVGSVFAAHAAVALSAARKRDQLEIKARTRDVIGIAKGILMAQSHITSDEAFDLLVRASQRLNMKLVVVAQQIADHPGRPLTG
jgi:transcriptional regulator with GAF, ATPase, and Fis domain